MIESDSPGAQDSRGLLTRKHSLKSESSQLEACSTEEGAPGVRETLGSQCFGCPSAQLVDGFARVISEIQFVSQVWLS